MFYFFWKLTTTTIGVGEPYYKRISLKAIIFDARVISQSSSHNNLPKSCHENTCRLTYSYVNIILLNIPTPRASIFIFKYRYKNVNTNFCEIFHAIFSNQFTRNMRHKIILKPVEQICLVLLSFFRCLFRI